MSVSQSNNKIELKSLLTKLGFSEYGFYNDYPGTIEKIENMKESSELVDLWLTGFKELSIMVETELAGKFLLLPSLLRICLIIQAWERDQLMKHISLFFKERQCKFSSLYKNTDSLFVLEESFKTITNCIKNNKNLLKDKKKVNVVYFGELLDMMIDFIDLSKADEDKKRILLYASEFVRIVSEIKEILKSSTNNQDNINKVFTFILYNDKVNRINENKQNSTILKSSLKVLRNFIFNKVSIKRKNFLTDLFNLTVNNNKEEAVLIDNLRILAKISEIEKIGDKLGKLPKLIEFIEELLLSKKDYILSATLQIIGNCLAYNNDFVSQLYKKSIIDALLKIFDRYCQKVS